MQDCPITYDNQNHVVNMISNAFALKNNKKNYKSEQAFNDILAAWQLSVICATAAHKHEQAVINYYKLSRGTHNT